MVCRRMFKKISIALENHSQILLTSCLVFCCFLPVHIILEIHCDIFQLKSEVHRENTKILIATFILFIIIGTIFGLIFWTMIDSLKLIFRLVVITTIVNILLVVFSFINSNSEARIFVLLILYGLLIGASQVTITTWFGEQYSDGNPNYTLFEHYLLYVGIHVLAKGVAQFVVPSNHHYGRIDNLEDYFIFEFIIMLISYIFALVLIIMLSKNSSAIYKSENLNKTRIKTINTNQVLLACLLYCPLIFIQIGVRILDKQFNQYFQSMDNEIIPSFSLVNYHMWPIKIVLAILCILNIIHFGRDEFYKIKLGCWLIVLSALISGLLNYNMKDTYHYYRKLQDRSGLIRFIWLGNDYYSTGANEQVHFKEDLLLHTYSTNLWIESYWDQFNSSNFTNDDRLFYQPFYYSYKHNIQSEFQYRYGAETWNIYFAECEEYFPQYVKYEYPLVHRHLSSLPVVYVIHNQYTFTDPLYFISDKLNISTSRFHFYQIPEGSYEVKLFNITRGKFYLKRGGLYLYFLYAPIRCSTVYKWRHRMNNNITSMIPIIRPYQFHIIWQLPQYVLLLSGVFMIISSALNLSLNMPNPNVKSQSIFAFCFTYDIGYLLYYVAFDTMGTDRCNILVMVILILSVGSFQLYEYLFDYVLMLKDSAK